MHWTTRYGSGRDRPRHNHLGDNGEECGCFSDDSWDGWTTNIKRRRHTICEAHKRKQEKSWARYVKHSNVSDKYNKDTECRLKELENFMLDVEQKYYDGLKRKIRDIEDNMVPIKYLREHHSSYVNNKRWFNVQKIRNRYYCCKNKIKYYVEWKNKMEIGMKRKRERFMLNKGWIDDDITSRDYKWIKNNDKPWLKEYKQQLRLKQTYDDECNYLVRMLEKNSI
jgi:hypothetical protein